MTINPDSSEINLSKVTKSRKKLIALVITILIIAVAGGAGGTYYRGIQMDKQNFSKSCGKFVSKINSSLTDYSNSSNKPDIILGDTEPTTLLRNLKLSVSAYGDFLKTNSRYSGSKESAEKLVEFEKQLAGFINDHNSRLSKEASNPYFTELSVVVRFYQANFYRYVYDFNDPVMKKIETRLLDAEAKFDRHMSDNFDPNHDKSKNAVTTAKTPLTVLCGASKK